MNASRRQARAAWRNLDHWLTEQFGPEPRSDTSIFDMTREAESLEARARTLRRQIAEKELWMFRRDAAIKGAMAAESIATVRDAMARQRKGKP